MNNTDRQDAEFARLYVGHIVEAEILVENFASENPVSPEIHSAKLLCVDCESGMCEVDCEIGKHTVHWSKINFPELHDHNPG